MASLGQELDAPVAFKMDGKDANFTGKDFVQFGKRHGLQGSILRAMVTKLIAPVS